MQIITDRRCLHQIPELELNLPKTMAYLQNALKGRNCQVFSPMESALCAWFDFGADSAIAFRADADALPITEKTGAPYASTHPGCMHACGHDGHMAILLELARRLSRKETLPHNVLLIFQPGEESPGGAKPICDTGILEQYGVTAIFGLHLWAGLPAGTMFCRENEMMARASELTVDIYGKSAHIARASEGNDALMAAVELYHRAAAMEQTLPEGVFRLLKFGKFHSGTVRNALSVHTHMEGSLRAFQDTVFDSLAAGLDKIAREVEQEFGCTVAIHKSAGYPAVMNPGALYRRAAECVEWEVLETPCMTAEDFAWYQRQVPGLFFFLGLGDTPALHGDTFDFDETILIKGADFFETLAEKFC